MKVNYTLVLGLVVFLSIFFTQDLSAQCAMCKAIVEDATENDIPIGKGINKGILYLMGIPYVLLFLLFRKKIFAFVKEWKQIH